MINLNVANYQSFFERLPHIEAYVFQYDKKADDFRFLLAGGEEFQSNGRNPSEVIGKTLRQVFPQDSDFFALHYKNSWQGEEAEFERLIGEKVFCFHFFAIRNSKNKVVLGVAIAHNITHLKAKERQLNEVSKLLIEISWDFSHRIRSFIARILGLTTFYKLVDSVEEKLFVIEQIEKATAGLDAETFNIRDKTESIIDQINGV